MKIQSSIVPMNLTRACKWGASVLLMIAPVGCAMETDYAEGGLGSVEQQVVTQTEKNRIDVKRTANSWLGVAYDPNPATAYWETTWGIVRQYSGGAVLYNRAKSTAYVADWDAYFGWTWIGGSQFGYPTGDQRAMASDSSKKVLPFGGGFLVSKPSTHDNWPVMTVVNENYSNGNAGIWCSANTQNQLGLTCSGFGFPPNTSVKTGYSGRGGMVHAVTETTSSTGSFTANLLPGGRVDAYNGIVTIFARAATGTATYQSRDYSEYPLWLSETKNMY